MTARDDYPFDELAMRDEIDRLRAELDRLRDPHPLDRETNMTARDDYPYRPFEVGDFVRWENMCDEIDRLRDENDDRVELAHMALRSLGLNLPNTAILHLNELIGHT